MADQVQFDFAVPDELLQEVVAKAGTTGDVADLAVMPGTGEGRPPPLIGILRQYGYAPLVLLTAAAIVPDTFGNGIPLIGNNLEHSFHIHDAALGCGGLRRRGGPAALGRAAGPVGRPGEPQGGGRGGPAGLLRLRPLDGPRPQRLGLHLPLPGRRRVGFGVNKTVHNSYLSDAYPTEGRGRIFSWHNLSDPLSLDRRHPGLRLVVTVGHNWRWGMLIALAGIPIALALFTLREPAEGARTSRATS